MYGDQSREFVFENNFELQRPALVSGAQSKAWQARPSPAKGRLARKVWPGKSGKPGQAQGFEVSLAIEVWLFRPH